MKNFRKVLALILVVATLFSFVAMVSAKDADDYSDYDKVSYAEAVDVLSAIGILDGYPDGTFRPTNTIKRSEMAKMIAVLSNAGDDVTTSAICMLALAPSLMPRTTGLPATSLTAPRPVSSPAATPPPLTPTAR